MSSIDSAIDGVDALIGDAAVPYALFFVNYGDITVCRNPEIPAMKPKGGKVKCHRNSIPP